MAHRLVHAIAAAAALVLGASAPAAAGGCCPGFFYDCGCGGVVALVPVPRTEIYVVNQGPVFSGPGPFLRQAADCAPRRYPYVGFVGYRPARVYRRPHLLYGK